MWLLTKTCWINDRIDRITRWCPQWCWCQLQLQLQILIYRIYQQFVQISTHQLSLKLCLGHHRVYDHLGEVSRSPGFPGFPGSPGSAAPSTSWQQTMGNAQIGIHVGTSSARPEPALLWTASSLSHVTTEGSFSLPWREHKRTMVN